MLMIATLALLVLAGWAGITAARLALWRGLVVALLPLVGIGLASAFGQPLLAYAALLPLGYFAYKNRGSQYDILFPVIGLVIAVWFWTFASQSSRLAVSAA